MKYAAGKHVYLLANLYNPAAYEWAWLNCNKNMIQERAVTNIGLDTARIIVYNYA